MFSRFAGGNEILLSTDGNNNLKFARMTSFQALFAIKLLTAENYLFRLPA